MIIDKLLNINGIPFHEAVELINEICNENTKLSLSQINFILNIHEKELVNIFFDKYKYFDQEEFSLIEDFINKNLETENKNYLSDLIYFATDFGLNINYEKILSLLIVEEEDLECLVLGCLEYINMNIKFLYIEELMKKLEYIRNNILYHQNEQLLASLILLRITHKIKYLDFITELIEYDKSNLEFLKNKLKEKMYNSNYFDFSELNKKIAGVSNL
ncbi:hypothetical protein [Flavobacterium sp. 140616W15]|uniref:hypothetical protein n=1 Tax=Flavobacterium sp. 140616W15 TaxID=2478552 RepID=UPI000F0CE230|nr:hypothetical protein [Flavobacterium sp. 140616W15]AYN03971.1 hypothetical protein EAG11_07020 [Flavobacterium sp. 140616W15]